MQETESPKQREPIFPPWVDQFVRLLGGVAAFGVVYLVLLVTYGFSPRTTDVGYMPKQPVPYSHRLHAGDLGIDCRYCHNTVEVAPHAAIPPTETCMNCHRMVRPQSPNLAPVFESYKTGEPIEWVRVHDLPDYVYFNHSAHVRRGVGCVSCHGRIDRMEEVYQAKMLSMGWCLECHRNPAPNLRPLDQITNMEWKPTPENPFDPIAFMKQRGLLDENGQATWRLQRLTSCSTCHR